MKAYPFDNLKGKGHYVQRVNGPNGDGSYGGLDRGFVNGKTVGNVRVYDAGTVQAPAWVLRASAGWCDACGQPKPSVELIAATELGWEVVASGVHTVDLLALWDSGPPGADPVAQVAAVLDPGRSGDVVAIEELEEAF